MIHPVNACEGKREQVDEQRRSNGEKARNAVPERHLQFKPHDRDDDREHTVAEGLETRCGEEPFRHRSNASVVQVHLNRHKIGS